MGCREAASSFATVAAAILLLAGMSATAGAAPGDPEASLSVAPDTISWPKAPGFERRLELTAGPQGFAGVVGFTDEGWGGRASGSPFSAGAASLRGPGELKELPMPAIDLHPGACYRGGPPYISFLPRYRLTLGPDQTTTVAATSRLLAAPLPGMPRSVGATVWPDEADSATELSTPLEITGKTGVRINSRFAGNGDPDRAELTTAQSFRLKGSTEPALVRQRVRLIAEWRMGPGPGSGRMVLATVRTDSSGRFRTPALWLDEGTWVLKTSLVKPGTFNNTPNCAGTVTVNRSKRPGEVTVGTVDGHTFRSIRIEGRTGIGRKRIRLRFFRHANSPDQPTQPYLGASAGCNALGARYRIDNGRLKWIGPVMQTMMGCGKVREANDRWLIRQLKRGPKADLNGRRLTLTRGKVRIVLQQVR